MSDRDEFVEGGGVVTNLTTPPEPEVLLRSRHSVPAVSLQSRDSHRESLSGAGNRTDRKKIEESLIQHLSMDLLSCDVKLSLFSGAAKSFRHDSVLSPFPPAFLDDTGSKDIKGIHDALLAIPPLNRLQRQLEQNSCQLSDQQLNLLSWVFNGGQSQLSLRTMTKVEGIETLRRVGVKPGAQISLPTHAFEVKTISTDSWMSNTTEENSFYGFHGSRLDNWFSILHNGLQQHRAKTSLFGEGIYLSSELGVSLNFISRGIGWDGSMLGSSLSCLAVARIKNHPSVKIHCADATRGRVEGSEGGNIPENYILVRDNQLIHIRYLFVYGNETGLAVQSVLYRNRFSNWISNNRLLVLLLGYGGLLLLVGMSSSPWFRRLLRKLGILQ